MSEKPLIDALQEKALDLAEEAKFVENGIVSRTVLRTRNARVVLFGFAEGQELSEHTSTKQALVQVVSGECDFKVNGKSNLMKAGDFLYMPPNASHAVIASKPMAMLLTLIEP